MTIVKVMTIEFQKKLDSRQSIKILLTVIDYFDYLQTNLIEDKIVFKLNFYNNFMKKIISDYN